MASILLSNPPLLNLQPPGAHRPHGLALLRLGFRPFYLCAASLAIVNVALWLAVSLGWLQWAPAINPLWWHAHEMLYGFASAVVIGFLLTAGRNWTGRATPRGAGLGTLVALWLAARLAAVLASGPWFMLLDVALLPIVAGVLARILLATGNRRNLPIVGILLLLSAMNLLFHLGLNGWLPVSPRLGLHAALALIVLLECVMGGRVIPGFTMSAVPGLKVKTLVWLDRLALGLTAAALALWVAGTAGAPSAAAGGWANGWANAWANPWIHAGVPLAAALCHAVRQWRWQPWRTRARPMLWILHAAHAWIVLGLLLLAGVALGLAPATAAIHALGAGATGGLVLGMMSRTARGHTGRTLQASRPEVLAFALVLAGAGVRVLGPLLLPDWRNAALVVAALLWCGAFALYLWVFTPWLLATRADGGDG